jgi:hypothetical protein
VQRGHHEENLDPRSATAGIDQFKVLFIDNLNVGSYLRDTLLADKVNTTEEAIMEIYRRLRPGDPPTIETARTSSTTCSSTRSATTCPRSAASS